MPLYIAHRINTLEELKKLPKGIGLEIDLRSNSSELVLSHEPFYNKVENFSSYLPYLKNRFIIANIKSERIEKYFLDLIKGYINDNQYFFLDSSFNVLALNGSKKEFSFAARYSEIESIETIENLINQSLIKWIWIDVFTSLPIDLKVADRLNQLEIKKCLTSPDLLGREDDIQKYAEIINKFHLKIDAICCKTKNIKIWEKYLEKY